MSEQTIERNDVDISSLFKWKTSVDLKDVEDNVVKTVYMRITGDADLNRARVASMRASAELRNKLRDETSDEYFAYIPTVENTEKENLVEMLLSLNMRDYTEEVEKSIKIKHPKKLHSDATLEEQEEFQKQVDEYPKLRLETIKEELEKFVDKKRKSLNRSSIENLITMYKQLLTNSLCEIEANKVFIGQCIVFGTFDDEKCTKKTFKDFEEYDNLPYYAKEQFVNSYYELQLGIADLKK